MRNKVTIASVDDININPLIKLSTIKNAVRLFSRELTAATKKTINLCLDLIHFRMSSNPISFLGDYYEYHGGKKYDQGLGIGGYESSLFYRPGYILPFWELQSYFQPDNLPNNLYIWQPGVV